MKTRIAGLFAGLLVGTSVAFAQVPTLPDESITIGKGLPDVELIDDTGATFQLRTIGDIPLIISPIFTRCPNICGMITSSLRDATAPIDGLGRDYNILTVSFDPADTVEDLRAYRTQHALPDQWRMAIGEPGQIATLLDALDFRVIALDGGGFAHPSAVAVIDAKRIVSAYAHGTSYETDDIRHALASAWASESVVVRFRGLITGVVVIALLSLVFTIVFTKNRSPAGAAGV